VAVACKRSNGHIEELRVALTAVNPAPILVSGLEVVRSGRNATEALAEAAAELAARSAKPLTTSALTPEYRREMIRVFTRRAVLALCSS
jgi:carbon-monoxide dehydrogenase medium subunit